jgi:hypothetical protein
MRPRRIHRGGDCMIENKGAVCGSPAAAAAPPAGARSSSPKAPCAVLASAVEPSNYENRVARLGGARWTKAASEPRGDGGGDTPELTLC